MSALRLSNDELNAFGEMVAAAYFATSVLGAALLTTEWYMVLSTLTAFVRMPKDQRRGPLIIATSCLILITSTIAACLAFRTNYLLLYNPTGMPYAQNVAPTFEGRRTAPVIGAVILAIALILGDVLMIWRCFMIWKNQKWVVVFPSLTFFGSVVFNIYYIVLLGSVPLEASSIQPTNKVLVAAVSLAVATNVIITFLILLRIGLAMRETRRVLPDRKPLEMYSRVVAIIIESAAPLAVFGICLLVTKGIETSPLDQSLVRRGRLAVFDKVASTLYYGFCSLSPQMIIFRVTTGQSLKPILAPPAYRGQELSQSIHFARSTAERGVFESQQSIDEGWPNRK